MMMTSCFVFQCMLEDISGSFYVKNRHKHMLMTVLIIYANVDVQSPPLALVCLYWLIPIQCR